MERDAPMTMTKAEEVAFDKKVERHFRGQRELPCGRNFMWDTYRNRTKEDMDNYRNNFDQIEWDEPVPGEGV